MLMLEQILSQYKLPVSFVMGMVAIIVLSKYVFPHLGGFSKFFTASKDVEIKALNKKIEDDAKLREQREKEWEERMKMCEKQCEAVHKENMSLKIKVDVMHQLIGLLQGVSVQLEELGVNIQPKVEKILEKL